MKCIIYLEKFSKMILSDLKQNLENLYRSDDMDYCIKNAGHLWFHWSIDHSLFLVGCTHNLVVLEDLDLNLLRLRFLKKVLKECYNIIPDKNRRYL